MFANRGDGTFAANVNYATTSASGSLAIGDVNGDGKPDLVSANSGFFASTVSVFANRGDGSFEAKVDYATGPGSSSVAIGDLNADGKPDLATANDIASTVSVLLNRGDGSFEASRDYVTGGSPRSVVIGDLNGDAKPDLATANYDADTVSVLVNRGDGTFQARSDYRAGDGPLSTTIGDLNGDGQNDVVVANALANEVSVLVNPGDGNFQARNDYATGRSPQSVAMGDLNGDGKPDLATVDYYSRSNSRVSVLFNKGDGRFQPRLDYATGPYPTSVAIGDLNGDGNADLVTANYDRVTVLLNTPGLCTVQDVVGRTLPAAKQAIARANCRVGKIRGAYSSTVERGRVISQWPKPGRVLPNLHKVNLVVSRGRRY